MILGSRPSLGMLAYLILNKSWYRFGVVMVAFGFATIAIVARGKASITLRYTKPAPFPPPKILLASQDHGPLTALDACSVEAAGTRLTKGRNPLYVYLWDNNLYPSDVWGKYIFDMEKVHLAYLDFQWAINRTPLERRVSRYSLGRWGDETLWTATMAALLWSGGGLLAPLGIVITKPMKVDTIGQDIGILVKGRDGALDPLLVATPSHHKLLEAMINKLVNSSSATSAEQVLTRSFHEACDISGLNQLPDSNCNATFNLLGREKVREITQDNMDGVTVREAFEWLESPEPALLQYQGDKQNLYDIHYVSRIFAVHQLNKFCPKVAAKVESLHDMERLQDI